MSVSTVYTVVRVKAGVPDPKPGCVVIVLAVNHHDDHVEYRTTDAPHVGDQISVSVSRVGGPAAVAVVSS